MKYAIDSSSIINLYNAGALELVGRIRRCQLFLPPLVVGECQPSCAAAILELKEARSLSFIDDSEVDASLFLALLEEHRLGDGETECITVALSGDYMVCCDDRKARETAQQLVGSDRVIGTLRLLRWSVEEQLTDCASAFALFREMKRHGGFLPDTPQTFFCGGA